MLVGCYTLDCYCDAAQEGKPHPSQFRGGWLTWPMQYTGETRAECVRKARVFGWRIGKDRQLCPVCMKRA